jgi:hypothetical protein
MEHCVGIVLIVDIVVVAVVGRRDNDYYPTPYDVIHKIMPYIDEYTDGFNFVSALDPGAGNARLLKTFVNYHKRECLKTVVETSKEHNTYPDGFSFINENYLTCKTPRKFNVIISNPPFSLALEFIKKSFELLDDHGTMFFLLRLGFLAGIRRYKELWINHRPTAIYILSKRPSFTDDNCTDSQEYAWFQWTKFNRKPCELLWL